MCIVVVVFFYFFSICFFSKSLCVGCVVVAVVVVAELKEKYSILRNNFFDNDFILFVSFKYATTQHNQWK